MITTINSPEEARAFLQEPLEGEIEEWLAGQVIKNLNSKICGLPAEVRSDIYALSIGVDPGVSYASGNFNTERAWSKGNIKPEFPEMTGRYASRNWTALAEGFFFVVGEANSDNEEQRLIDWYEEFNRRIPEEADIDPHLGCWRIIIHAILRYRESESGRLLAKIPFISEDSYYSDYYMVFTELMNPDGQAEPYIAEVTAGIALYLDSNRKCAERIEKRIRV